MGNIPPVSLNRVLMTLTNGIRLPIFDIVPLCNIESRRLNDNFGNILFDNGEKILCWHTFGLSCLQVVSGSRCCF